MVTHQIVVGCDTKIVTIFHLKILNQGFFSGATCRNGALKLLDIHPLTVFDPTRNIKTWLLQVIIKH